MNPEPQEHPDDVFTPVAKSEWSPLTQNITTVSAMFGEVALLAQERVQTNAIGQI